MYVIVKINFLGNDDFDFQGYVIGQALSVEDIEDKIKKNLDDEFQDGVFTIYHSDNDGTPFESSEDVMNTLKIKEITKEQYDNLMELLGNNYGSTTSFMNVF